MKKIISSRSALVLHSYAVIVFFALPFFFLWPVISKTTSPGEKAMELLLFGFTFGMFCFLLFSLNRSACVVWFEDGLVKRKGLFRGFYKECPVRAIQTVKIQYVSQQVGFGTFIFLVEDRKPEDRKFLRMRKDSYISFRKNKKNMAFLRTFWSGKIES